MRVFGHESHSLPGNIKARVGFVPQQDELLDQLSVADQLRVIASFYPRWDSALITRLCGEWGVTVNARIKSMSVGERQKLSILLAFGHQPELLILDEPVASLDPMARRQFLEQLLDASRPTASAPSCSPRTSSRTSSGSRTASGFSRKAGSTGRAISIR